MSATQKDLAYYLSNPDEMPTDPKEIERLASEHMQGALDTGKEQVTIESFVKKDEKPESSPVEAPKEEAKTEAPKEDPKVEKPEEKPEEKPTVLAKDGKNVIPYAVLQGARERAEAAENLAAERAAEIERLKAEAEGKKVPEAKPETTLTDEELQALETESPTLAKTLRAYQAQIRTLTDTVKTLKDHTEGEIAREASEIKSEIQQAIDANPILSAWQADKDQTLWNEAARIDKILRASPKYAEVPFSERFARVAELTAESMGIEIPKKEEPPKEEPKKPKLTDDEIRAAAEAKLKGKATPKSLSDIPGGTPPAVDERDRVEQMSAAELGNKMMKMTSEQLQAYLATL